MKAKEIKQFIRYCQSRQEVKVNKQSSALLKHLTNYIKEPGDKNLLGFFQFISCRLSVKTTEHILSRMKKLLTDAYAEKILAQDYMEQISIRTYLNLSDNYLTEADFKALVIHKDKIKPVVAHSFLFCVYMGFTLGKIKKLTFADLGQYKLSEQASGIINEIIAERNPFSKTDLIFYNLPSKPSRSTEFNVCTAWAGFDRVLSYRIARNTYIKTMKYGH